MIWGYHYFWKRPHILAKWNKNFTNLDFFSEIKRISLTKPPCPGRVTRGPRLHQEPPRVHKLFRNKNHVVSRTWAKKCICKKFPFVHILFVFFRRICCMLSLYPWSGHKSPFFWVPETLTSMIPSNIRQIQQADFSPKKTRSFDQWLQIVWLSKENHGFGSCFFFRFLSLQVFRGSKKFVEPSLLAGFPWFNTTLSPPSTEMRLILGVHPLRRSVSPRHIRRLANADVCQSLKCRAGEESQRSFLVLLIGGR